MSSLRKQRGVKNYEMIEHAQQRTQWNMDMAQRALENLFPEITTPDGTTVRDYNSICKKPNYNAESLARRAEEYFQDIYHKNVDGCPIIPDIEDFCIFANMSRQTYFEYLHGTDLKMSEICSRINSCLALCKKQLAFDGHINPTVFAIDFNNNHGYIQQKSQIEIRSQNMNIEARDSIDDIASRIPMSEDWKVDKT